MRESRRAIKIKPDYAPAYAKLGFAQALMGETDAAIQSFRECVRLDPKQSDVLANLAGAYFEKGRDDLAIHYYELAIKIEPNHEATKRILPLARKRLAERARAIDPTSASQPAPLP